jgi:hypothetical protein
VEKAADNVSGEEPPQLTEEQDRVAQRVQQLVKAMAVREMPPLKNTRNFLPRIEEQRESRVILIEGESGSGKTSVLLTLIDDWCMRISKRLDRVPIFPIEIIELQPLAPSTNLLIHIASTLLKVIVETIEGEAILGEKHPPWHPVRQQELTSLSCWRKFLRAAVAASDDSLLQRRDLDAEALAVELESTEFQRLDVATAFYDLVDALVKDLANWPNLSGREPPLLILSINDADLNPHFSVALLNLLRTLYHPRLAYLLTGDNGLFMNMLRMHFFGALFRPMQDISVTPTDIVQPQYQADRLAMLTYDRLVPDRQRCRIDDLDMETRIDKLKETLSKLPLETNVPGNFKNILAYVERVPETRLALPHTMRGILDLRAQLALKTSAAARPEGPPVAPWLVKNLWDQAVRSVPFSSEDRHVLESRLLITERGALRVHSDQIGWDVTRLPRFRPSAGKFNLLLSELGVVGANLERSKQEPRPLPQSVVAAFMLANIVAIDSLPDRFVSSRAPERPFDLTLVTTAYDHEHQGRLSFGWPLPNNSLLLDILIICDRWKTEMTSCGSASLPMEQIAVFFLELVIATEKTRDPSHVRLKTVNSDEWSILANNIVELMNSTRTGLHTTRQSRLAEWARERAGLLAAPESGLPDDVAQAFLEALKSKMSDQEWQIVATRLVESRHERASYAIKNAREMNTDFNLDESTLLHEIDAKCDRSPWLTLVEQVAQTRTSGSHREDLARRTSD